MSHHAFIFSDHHMPVRVLVDPEPVLGTLLVSWEYTLNGTTRKQENLEQTHPHRHGENIRRNPAQTAHNRLSITTS